MGKQPCVYILASKRNGTLYMGVTSNVALRVWTHKEGAVESFTKRHAVHRLVYFEMHATMQFAIQREKQLKKWRRRWKLELMEQFNPEWKDLTDHFAQIAGRVRAWEPGADVRPMHFPRCALPVETESAWIPAFAGMTNKNRQ
jgi:putative endonuclease